MKYLTVLAILAGAAKAEDPSMITLHGSGTTNPSKCYWKIMQQITDSCRTPLWMTYRAIGSGNGIKEFLGVDNGYKAYNQFGSGDVPLSQSQYDGFNTTYPDKNIYHLPVVMGAITFFHSIPGVSDGVLGLNMTGCLLARVFNRDIKFWDHADILAKNPGLKATLDGKKLPITVSVRTNGSSSTSSITKYLYDACPAQWPKEKVKKEIDWGFDWTTDGGVKGVEGSSQMTAAINSKAGTIGYIDAGHGHAQGLIEIELENKDGKYLSSKEAMNSGGIAAAAAELPDDFSKSFADVTFINKPGPKTWPIVAMSYIYVREDLADLGAHVNSLALLRAFLTSLYDDDVISLCDEFGFARIPADARTKALDIIETKLKYPAETPEFIFENSTVTNVGKGQGAFVISKKISRYAHIVTDAQAKSFKKLDEKTNKIQENVAGLEKEENTGTTTPPTTPTTPTSTSTSQGRKYTDDDNSKLNAALALGSISIALWSLTFFVIAAKKLCGL